MKRTVIATSPDSDYVKLARTAAGTIFRKEILKMNDSFVHPSDPNRRVRVDKGFATKLVDNFRAGYADIVQFPVVDEGNRHTESPLANMGEVIDLTYDDKGIYATIDVRKNPGDVGTVLLGASAMMSLDYKDTRSGNRVGPTLLHVAGTNRPYVTNLGPYEQVALSADTTADSELVMLTNAEEETMDLDEMLEALKSEHGIDVIALQEQAGKNVQLSNTGDAGSPELFKRIIDVARAVGVDEDIVSLSNSDEPSASEVADAVIALARSKAEADEQLETFHTEAAESEVDGKIEGGYILPKQRDVMLELRLSNPEAYETLLPENPIVQLSQDGIITHERPGSADFENLESEVERLTAAAKSGS